MLLNEQSSQKTKAAGTMVSNTQLSVVYFNPVRVVLPAGFPPTPVRARRQTRTNEILQKDVSAITIQDSRESSWRLLDAFR